MIEHLVKAILVATVVGISTLVNIFAYFIVKGILESLK